MIPQWFSDVLSTANEAGYQVDYGYRSVWESIPVDTLKNHIIEGHPVIIPVGSGLFAEHFVVVVGYDETQDVFYLHDPDHYVTQGRQNTNKGYDIAISSESFLDYWDSMFYPGIPRAPAYCGWMVIKINNATHSRTSFHTVDDARNERDINSAPDVINAPDVILSDSSPDN